jgi:hypothetical protein
VAIGSPAFRSGTETFRPYPPLSSDRFSFILYIIFELLLNLILKKISTECFYQLFKGDEFFRA